MINYKNVVAALHRLIDPSPEGFGLSARAITVSTVGLVPLIRKLATEGMPVTLAVSLHAPDDELRDELIPVNSKWKVGELLDAAYDYFRATGRRVSIEYALIKDRTTTPGAPSAWRMNCAPAAADGRTSTPFPSIPHQAPSGPAPNQMCRISSSTR